MGRILRVIARSQPDIAIIGTAIIRRIKPDPAKPRVNIDLALSMGRLV